MRHKVKGSDRVTFSPPHLAMTIICCLASLPVEVFWHLLAPFRRYICAYATTRDGRTQLAAVLVKSQTIDYAFTRACFRAREIRILGSSGSVERIIPCHETERKL